MENFEEGPKGANGETPISKTEDNPVASIEWFIQKLRKFTKTGYGEKFISEFEKYLIQHARETDKVQPTCTCKVKHHGYKIINVCTDCNGIKDKVFWEEVKSIPVYDCERCGIVNHVCNSPNCMVKG